MGNKDRKDRWAMLLSHERLYGKPIPRDENNRSEYDVDYDRIIFSSAFRRLQDKTQVFPLSGTDYTHTRLTHTLEVSSVGRTLGMLAAKHLAGLGADCEPTDVGTIVATACLAHDLGNPPFGHSGEAAIQAWAKKRLPAVPNASPVTTPTLRARRAGGHTIPMRAEEFADFHLFEGNAQGFRTLVRTGARTMTGGMRPTLATLGAMAKYPRPSLLTGYEFKTRSISEKKPGYFRQDSTMATRAFRRLGMVEKAPGVFSRHPLAFLTEAADDVCYAIADLADGFKVGAVTFDEVREVLLPVASVAERFSEWTFLESSSRLVRMCATAVRVLVSQCIEAFRASLEEMELGTLDAPLVDRTKLAKEYQAIKALAKQKVYRDERVLQIEYAGYQTLGGLLDMFHAALCECRDEAKDEKLRKLFPRDFLWAHRGKGASAHDDPVRFTLGFMTQYERMLAVTDYISGMTDRFAVQLYQRLSGIRLPD